MVEVPDPVVVTATIPPVQDVPVEQAAHADPVYNAHLTLSNFFAAYGWYILFGFIVFSLVWKNLEQKLEKLRRAWEDAKIKKNPDAYHAQEESRFAKLEKLQAQYDKQAIIRKERDAEIAAARRERDEAKQECKGKASMKQWEEGKTTITKSTGQSTGNSSDQTKQRKKPTTFKRADYNPLTGSSGGSSGFKSSRPKRSGGG